MCGGGSEGGGDGVHFRRSPEVFRDINLAWAVEDHVLVLPVVFQSIPQPVKVLEQVP